MMQRKAVVDGAEDEEGDKNDKGELGDDENFTDEVERQHEDDDGEEARGPSTKVFITINDVWEEDNDIAFVNAEESYENLIVFPSPVIPGRTHGAFYLFIFMTSKSLF